MITLITGGSGSGKSAYAEQKVVEFGDFNRIYIATMYPFDEESHQRIARHRAMRAEKNFSTVECYVGLKNVKIPKHSCVLLECLSNLTANEMFQENGAKEHVVGEILEGVKNLDRQAEQVVIVTNEIFSDGIEYDEETKQYQKYLGEINVKLAVWAQEVTEVVYGIPLQHKKTEKKEGQKNGKIVEQL